MDTEDKIKLKEQELKELRLRKAFEVLEEAGPEEVQAAFERLKKAGKIK